MALTQADCTALTHTRDDTDGTSFTVAMSQALSNNTLGLLRTMSQGVLNEDPNLASITMSGVTMTQVETTSLSSFQREWVHRCLSATSGSGGANLVHTYTSTSQTYIRRQAYQWANVDTGGTNGANALVQTVRATGTSSTPSVTITAPASANGVQGMYRVGEGGGGAGVFTAGTDFTIKGPTDMNTDPQMTGEAAAGSAIGDGVVDATTTNSVGWIMHGFEIKEAAAGGGGEVVDESWWAPVGQIERAAETVTRF